jgi:hypothetical protein
MWQNAEKTGRVKSVRDARRVVEGVGGDAKLVRSLETGRYRRDRATAAEGCRGVGWCGEDGNKALEEFGGKKKVVEIWFP